MAKDGLRWQGRRRLIKGNHISDTPALPWAGMSDRIKPGTSLRHPLKPGRLALTLATISCHWPHACSGGPGSRHINRLSNRSPCFAGADADHRLPTPASQIQARDSTVLSWRSREKSRGRRRAPYRHRLAAGEHRQSGHLQLSARQPRYRLYLWRFFMPNNKSQLQRQ